MARKGRKLGAGQNKGRAEKQGLSQENRSLERVKGEGRSPPPGLPLLLDAFFDITKGLIFVGRNLLILLGIVLAGLFYLGRIRG